MKKIYLTGALLASALRHRRLRQPAATNNAAAGRPTRPLPRPRPSNAAGGEATEAAAPAGDQTNQNFTLVNNTGHTVVTLNVSPNNENEWGPDILGADTLANGQTAQITFPRGEEQCSWDIRATYDDGDTTDARGVDLCHIATVTLTAANSQPAFREGPVAGAGGGAHRLSPTAAEAPSIGLAAEPLERRRRAR